MVNLLIGATGSGKTYFIKEEISKIINKYEKVIFLVPEQISFEFEKELFNFLGFQGYANCQILSFKRLCNLIFRELGGLANEDVNDYQSLINVFLSLKYLKDDLVLYGNKTFKSEFILNVFDVINNFKNVGIDLSKLEDILNTCEDGAFKNKMSDIFKIYQKYESLMLLNKSDVLGDIDRAIKKVMGSNFFSQYHIFIDSFNYFSYPEYMMLKQMIDTCENIYISFPIIDNYNSDLTFTHISNTYKNILQIIKDCDKKVNKILFEDFKRPLTSNLIALNKHLLNIDYEKCEADGSVDIYKSLDKYESAKFVAAKINQLVKCDGYRYRDICIYARDINYFKTPLDIECKSYNIPLFIDQNECIIDKPIISFIINLLKLINTGFRSEYLMNYIKSPFLNIEEQSVFEFENYVYVWSVDKADFNKEFTKNPRGLGREKTDLDIQVLNRIEKLRIDYINPVFELQNNLKNKSGKDITKLIYSFLEDMNLKDNTKNVIDGMDEIGHIKVSNIIKKMWTLAIDLLDNLHSSFNDEIISIYDYLEVFILSSNYTKYGVIPKNQDCVAFCDVTRSVANNPKIVFVLGANAGDFPKAISTNSILNFHDRKTLKNLGVPLIDDNNSILYKEHYYAYNAITLASHYLCVVFEERNINGEEKTPSKIVYDILGCIKDMQIKTKEDYSKEFFIYNNENLIDFFCDQYDFNIELKDTLINFFKGVNEYEEFLHKLFLFKKSNEYMINDKTLLNKIYKDEIYLSPTHIKSFNNCKFSYFLKHILNVKKDKKAEFSYTDIGNITHYVIQKTINSLDQSFYNCSIEEIEQFVNHFTDEFIKITFQNVDIDYMHQVIFENMKKDLVNIIIAIQSEILSGKFKIADMEMKIDKNLSVKPYQILYKDKKINLIGVVDRVDIFDVDGEKYIRVIDYKTGNKTFDFENFVNDMDFQLFVYLFSIGQSQDEKYKGSKFAGAFYMPSRIKYNEKDDKLNFLVKSFEFKGVAINNEKSINVLGEDNPYLKSIYKKTKAGFKGKFMISEDILTHLKNYIDVSLQDILKSMLNGDIKAIPSSNDPSKSPCNYCEYKFICKIEDKDKLNCSTSIYKDEFLKLLSEVKKDETKMD